MQPAHFNDQSGPSGLMHQVANAILKKEVMLFPSLCLNVLQGKPWMEVQLPLSSCLHSYTAGLNCVWDSLGRFCESLEQFTDSTFQQNSLKQNKWSKVKQRSNQEELKNLLVVINVACNHSMFWLCLFSFYKAFQISSHKWKIYFWQLQSQPRQVQIFII